MTASQPKNRFWWWYVGIFVCLIAASIMYGVWRERTLEPVAAPIVLDQPGVVRRSVGFLRFHNSRYHPGFHLRLSVPTDDEWPEGDQSLKIWSDDPPHVEIEVQSSDGATMLRESGPISEANGWVVTGGVRPGETELTIYKLTEFTGSPFSRYDVVVRVVKGTSSRRARSFTFYISTIKSYALLPNAFATLLLVVTFVVSTPSVIVIRYLRRRRRRSVVAGA